MKGHLTASSALATALLFLQCNPTAAAPVTSNGATKAVRGWLKADARPFGKAMGGSIRRVETFNDQTSNALYYVVYLAPAGFVIVPADDSVEPIIAFADKGQFNPSLSNPLGALVSADLPGRVAQARAMKTAAHRAMSLRATGQWQKYQQLSEGSAGGTNGPANALLLSDVRVAPLLQSQWDQQEAGGTGSGGPACYNYYTPPYASGSQNNYVCGCVATAMAQVMRFYQYPTTSVGTGSYSYKITDVPTSGPLRGGDGSGGAYVWANMPLVADYNTSVTQCQQIGNLIHDAGLTVGMNYNSGNGGSSSADTLAPKVAFMNTFHYGNAVKGFNNANTIMAGIVGMANPNLDAGYPVMLGISGTPGGHSVVCDGYGYIYSTLYHHLNMGWSGQNNAWYALPIIDTASGAFNLINACVYNIFTNGSGEIISGRIVTDLGYPIPNVTVTATRSGGGTYTTVTRANGIYALPSIPSSSTYSLLVSANGFTTTTTNVTTGTSSDFNLNSGNVWGVDVVLVPVGLDHFQWSAIGSVQVTNTPFAVTLTAQNSTNATVTSFNGKVSFSVVGDGAGTSTNSIIPTNSTPKFGLWWNQNGGVCSEGYSFTPTNDIQVSKVKSFEGTNVTIWTASGTQVLNQTVVNNNGSWTTTTLASNVTLYAYNQYTIAVSYAIGTTYTNSDRLWSITNPPAAFGSGIVGSPLIGWNGVYEMPYASDTFNFAPVDFVYTLATPPTLTPTISGNFVNGVWSGNLAVLQACSNVVVTANDGTNHTGSSSTFLVVNSASTASLTVTASPSNAGTVSGGGTFTVGSSQNILATATNAGYAFGQWQDGNTQSSRIVTIPAGGTNYTATFVSAMASLTVSASPSNAGTVSGGGTFTVGSSHSISATATNAGYVFSQWQDGNTQTTRTVTIPAGGTNNTATFTQISSGVQSYAVNAGGSAAGTFAADSNFSGGTAGTPIETAIDVSSVTNPAPQAVYQSERYGTFGYTFTNLNAGNSYLVRLHFAEIYSSYFVVGRRQFNVSINGTSVLANFDIFASAGAGNKAMVKEFNVPANSGGQIGVGFTNVLNGAKVSGIEIYQTAAIAVAASPSNAGTVSGGGTFTVGSSQSISATATNAGYVFSQWQDGNTQNPRTVTVPAGGTNYTATFIQYKQSVGSLFFAVNGGGGAAGTFVADTGYAGGTGNPSVAPTVIDVSAVTNPAPQAVYQSERFGNFAYTFGSLNPGNSYFVRLHFSEDYYSAAGKRVFNVWVNGAQVLTNFDIISAAGAEFKAVVKEYTVQPNTRGQINIGFTNGPADAAKVSGIEIYNMSGNVHWFTAPTFTSGHFQATLNGMATSNYIVYMSTNLITWQQWGTVTAQSVGTTNIIDANSGPRVRFYRAVRTP